MNLRCFLWVFALGLGLFIANPASSGQTVTGVPHPTGTMVFTLASSGGNCNGCEWMAAEGPITERTPADFESFLKSVGLDDGTEDVELNSDGGNLIGGLLLGEAIRRHKFNTGVARTVPMKGDPMWQTTAAGGCYSACAYAFLGGVKRSAASYELGFHQFHSQHSTAQSEAPNALSLEQSSTQRVMGLLVTYLNEMSVDPGLLSEAASADPSQLYRPELKEMRRLRIVNVSDAPSIPGWTVEPYKSGAVVTATISGGYDADQQVTFFCRSGSPGLVFMLASWGYASATPARAVEDDNFLRSAVWGSRILIGGRLIRENQGYSSIVDAHVDSYDRYSLTYELSQNEFDAGLRLGALEIEVDGPHALGNYGFDFRPPMTGLASAAEIAFKSCI